MNSIMIHELFACEIGQNYKKNAPKILTMLMKDK